MFREKRETWGTRRLSSCGFACCGCKVPWGGGFLGTTPLRHDSGIRTARTKLVHFVVSIAVPELPIWRIGDAGADVMQEIAKLCDMRPVACIDVSKLAEHVKESGALSDFVVVLRRHLYWKTSATADIPSTETVCENCLRGLGGDDASSLKPQRRDVLWRWSIKECRAVDESRRNLYGSCRSLASVGELYSCHEGLRRVELIDKSVFSADPSALVISERLLGHLGGLAKIALRGIQSFLGNILLGFNRGSVV